MMNTVTIKMNVTKLAREQNCIRKTLSRRLNGIQKS